jgi:uncharacterized membrane protein (UPF0127 family)
MRTDARRSRVGVTVATIVVVVCGLGLIASLVWFVRSRNNGGGDATFRLARTTRASSPFTLFDEARVALDGRCTRVLVALSVSQRVQGLRGVRTLDPYAGMLFVFPSDTSANFTMAQTPLPLDITFFDADGHAVDHTTMDPCPDGSDSSCPAYGSHRRYRYALERPGSPSSVGAVGSCA